MKILNIITRIILTGIVALTSTSCHHKDLVYSHVNEVTTEVIFDWQKAPDADPKSMALYMYESSSDKPLRYIFSDKFGGQITLPYGRYSGLAMNSDNTDWARTRATEDIENFEIYTPDVEELSAYNLTSRSIPRAAGTEDERLASTPGMMWCDRGDDIDMPAEITHKTITFYPEEAVCHYTVDILDVDNLKYLHGSEIDGTLSGMAEGFYDGKMLATDNKVTMSFVLSMNEQGNGLHAEFLTFGECPHNDCNHVLSLYMILTDGTKLHYTWDVSNQISDAPDSTHVNIVVRGLTIPQPINNGGGFKPDVNDWVTEHIGIKM
ncbi:MAG: DUF5119 domain-containing protein [Muribaculaceae bacterium]|nr:DUF5119 domain-containing protein [Muribaculaceae bacterium]